MEDPDFFLGSFYNQIVECQKVISNLNKENFNDSLSYILRNSGSHNLKTLASTLLNQIKIQPAKVNLIIDFIEKFDEFVKANYSDLDSYHSTLMPIFASIVNPLPQDDQFFLQENKSETDSIQDLSRFSPVPVSECFIYENLRQRGHIRFDLNDYHRLNWMKEKMPHLFPTYCSYEVGNDYNFIKSIPYIHLMPSTEYTDFVSKFEFTNFCDFQENDAFAKLAANDFEEHKKYLLTGFNPQQLPTCLRKDDLIEFENIILRTQDFDFSQIIKLSIYDCNVMIKNSNLLEYTAYFGSKKCFEYIFRKSPNVKELFTSRIAKFSVIGGDEDIFKIVDEQLKLIQKEKNENKIEFDNQNDIDPFYVCLPYSLAFHHRIISENLIKFKGCPNEFDIYNSDGTLSNTLNCFYFANWSDMTLLAQTENNTSMFLLAAAMFNNSEMFRNIIEIPGINLNIKYDEMYLINYLVRYDNHEMINLLLEKAKMDGKKLDLDHPGFSYISPIMYCCFLQYFKSFSVLIQNEDIDVNRCYKYLEVSDECDEFFNLMTICLKFRQFKMARMILNHPKFELRKTIEILEAKKEPYNNNIVLSLNYLLDEKKRRKKVSVKKIDVSGFDD